MLLCNIDPMQTVLRCCLQLMAHTTSFSLTYTCTEYW